MSTGPPSTPRAWVLNLDVEHELQQPGGYTRSEGMLGQVREAISRLEGFLGVGDVVLPPGGAEEASAVGMRGDAWCPTPRALDVLRFAGATVPDAPSVEILRRVNDRAFAVALDPGPLGTRYITGEASLRQALGRIAGPWLLKRGLSFGARGHRPGRGEPSEEDLRWFRNAGRSGLGVAVEPLATREQDFAQHGFVTRVGVTVLGEPTAQICNDRGVWEATLRESELGDRRLGGEERARLCEAGLRAGRGLADAGYFGPFGVDAFRYEAKGRRQFNPWVEINARYSMGWALSGCPRRAD